jgi:hypothetical protein
MPEFIAIGRSANGWWFSPQVVDASSHEEAAVKYDDPRSEEAPAHVYTCEAPEPTFPGQWVRYRIERDKPVVPPPRAVRC